jgi:hypothetical protein
LFLQVLLVQPLQNLYEELNSTDKDRVFGTAGFTFDLAKGLTLDIKSGIDLGTEFAPSGNQR